MAEELKKMAVDVEELPDGLIIHGSLQTTPVLSGVEGSDKRQTTIQLNGRSDHRIVMALSLAGLAIDGGCCIDTAEAINVTFPEYVNLMKTLAADMEVE